VHFSFPFMHSLSFVLSLACSWTAVQAQYLSQNKTWISWDNTPSGPQGAPFYTFYTTSQTPPSDTNMIFMDSYIDSSFVQTGNRNVYGKVFLLFIFLVIYYGDSTFPATAPKSIVENFIGNVSATNFWKGKQPKSE
jgi:hypothetical protein